MILRSLMSGDIRNALIWFLMSLPIIILSLSVHESAHAFVSYKLGDPTARNLGRITLNPLKHLDPIGFIMMLVVGFGWAKPVPINARNFRNPRYGMALSSLAGPVSNLLLAVVFCGIMSIFWFTLGRIQVVNGEKNTVIINIFLIIYNFLYLGIFMNVALAVFNFIPVPPLDGSRIISLLIPAKYYFRIMKYERFIGLGFMFIVIALSYMNVSVISWVVNPITDGLLWLFGVR